MLEHLIKLLQQDKTFWEANHHLFQEKKIPPKTTLLNEGEISHYIHFIKNGCLRMWFNNDGKDVTFQFFFESQAVSSFESFFNNSPSQFSLESIEPSTIISLGKDDFDKMNRHFPELGDGFQKILLKRLENYAMLFLSRIKDNPQKRYNDLLKNNPEIIQRIPQHYIASYLGITPTSLSRIRNKK